MVALFILLGIKQTLVRFHSKRTNNMLRVATILIDEGGDLFEIIKELGKLCF